MLRKARYGRSGARAFASRAASILITCLLATTSAFAETVVRIGALQHGTVGWELDVIRHHGLDREAGIRLEVQPVASRNAAAIALQGGAVDVIVTDWLWVSRQRHQGRAWTFHPWSMAVGSIMARPDAGIDGVADLGGRRLGVAGGPVDKSWLLLKAYYRRLHGEEITDSVEPVFAAPPLLNRLMLGGDLPAVINYWHYSARLRAAGMRPLLQVEDMLSELGVERPVPLLGWVFGERWAEENPAAIRGLLAASREAKTRLAGSEAEWRRLRPLTRAEDEAALTALRDGFRAGIPRGFGTPEIEAARALFTVLAAEGGKELTGGQTALAPGTFWRPREGLTAWRR